MDFEQALEVHRKWKERLRRYLEHPDDSLCAADVAVDDKCELGKWLHSEGARFAPIREYQIVLETHARFHKAASDVVRRANAGENVSGETDWGAKSEFFQLSCSLVNAIKVLSIRVEQETVEW